MQSTPVGATTCPICKAQLGPKPSGFLKLVIFTVLWAVACAVAAYYLARYKPMFSDSYVQGCDPYSPCRDGLVDDYVYGGFAVGLISGGLLGTIVFRLWRARR